MQEKLNTSRDVILFFIIFFLMDFEKLPEKRCSIWSKLLNIKDVLYSMV